MSEPGPHDQAAPSGPVEPDPPTPAPLAPGATPLSKGPGDEPTELVEEKVVEKLSEDKDPSGYRELNVTRRTLTPNQWVQRLVVITVMVLISGAFTVLIITMLAHPARDMTTYAALVITPLVSFAGPIVGFYFSDKRGPRQ